METYTEISSKELARQQRARQYEALLGDRTGLQNRIKMLEAQSYSVDVIEKIMELAGQIPGTVLTAGRSSLAVTIPYGISGRLVIEQAASAALADGRRREAARQADLKDAKAKLVKVEEDLQEYED